MSKLISSINLILSLLGSFLLLLYVAGVLKSEVSLFILLSICSTLALNLLFGIKLFTKSESTKSDLAEATLASLSLLFAIISFITL